MAHITGGGLAANLARVMPGRALGHPRPRAPGLPRRSSTSYDGSGSVSQNDLEATLNCGVGMVALLPADDVDRAIETLAGFRIDAWAAGEVTLDDRARRRRTADRSAPRLD